MRSIAVSQLKTCAEEVIRVLQRNGVAIDVTHHGRVVARLVPVRPPRRRSRRPAVWSTIDEVAREIGRRWPKGMSAADALREGRRDLGV